MHHTAGRAAGRTQMPVDSQSTVCRWWRRLTGRGERSMKYNLAEAPDPLFDAACKTLERVALERGLDVELDVLRREDTTK